MQKLIRCSNECRKYMEGTSTKNVSNILRLKR